MVLDTIFDRATLKIKWENVWNIPEFSKLIETPHSKKWHKEGNVSIHTKMVVDAMDNEIKYDGTNGFFKTVMMLSALFHDIGKGETTFFNVEKNDWSATNHAEEGEKITRRLIWDFDPILRECICYFVRNHMKPLYIQNNPNCVKEVISLSCDGLYPDICNLKNLCLLKKCDNLGSIFDYDNWREKLDFVELLADKYNCYTKPYKFKTDVSKWCFLNESTNNTPTEVADESVFNVYIPIGSASFDEQKNMSFVCYDNNDFSIDDDIVSNLEKKETFVLEINDMDNDLLETILSLIYLYQGKIIFVYGSDKFQQYISPNLCMSIINKN